MTAIEDARAAADRLRSDIAVGGRVLDIRDILTVLAEHERLTADMAARDAEDVKRSEEGRTDWDYRQRIAALERLTAPPTDDEREALADLIEGVGVYISGSHGHDYINPGKAADAIIAAGFRRQGPTPTVDAWKDTLASVRLRQIAKGYTPDHDREHGIRHVLNWAIDYARRGRSEDSAGMIVAALELVDSGALLGQGPITDEWEYGVEYEVSSTESVYTAAHSERQARKWVGQSPTDTGLRRRRKAGPWEPVEAGGVDA